MYQGKETSHDRTNQTGIDYGRRSVCDDRIVSKELLRDGPLIAGFRFTFFVDMEVTRRATGERNLVSEIATCSVRDGQIPEERFFFG